MSNTAVHANSSTQTFCCCFNREFLCKTVKEYHWLEVAALTSAAVLVLLSFLAFVHTGAFSSTPYSVPMGLACLGVAGAILFGELIYKIVTYCTLSCKKDIKEQTSPPAKPKENVLPETSLKARLQKAQPTTPITATETRYSPHRSASDKMSIQLDAAVRAGREEKRKQESPLFKVNVKADIDTLRNNAHTEDWVVAAATTGETTNTLMKEAHVVKTFTIKGQSVHFVGVFDELKENGTAASYLKDNLSTRIENDLNNLTEVNDTSLGDMLTKLSVELDTSLNANEMGATAAGILIFQNSVYLFNSGNARATLVRKEAFFQLTEEADPKNLRFKHGLEKKGCTVDQLITARGWGAGVVARPKITHIDKGITDDLVQMKIGYNSDDYLLIGSDGFWKVATNQEVLKAFQDMQEAKTPFVEMSARLVYAAQQAKSQENITALVIKL